MDNKINCTVSNCEYWGSGNKCESSSITVTAGALVSNGQSSMQSSVNSDTPTQYSSGTFCSTFKNSQS